MAGDLAAAEAQARVAAPTAAAHGPAWAMKFLLQQARIATYRGDNPSVVALLEPSNPSDSQLAVTRDALLAIAYARTGDLRREQSVIRDGETRGGDDLSRAKLRWAQGVIAFDQGKLAEAEQAFELSLSSARASGDRFQEAQALLNTGVVALRQDHYEDALERFKDASAVASEIGARQALAKAQGNAGSTFYKLGDFPQALAIAKTAEEQARVLGSPIDQANWLAEAGMSQYRMGDLSAACSSFERSYQLAQSIQNTEEIGDALFALASLSLQQGDLNGAQERAQEAIRVAEQSGSKAATLQPSLLQAIITARQGDRAGAEARLLGLLHGDAGAMPRPFEKWQMQSALGRLAGEDGHHDAAGRWYRQAIETYSRERSSVNNIEARLPFVENGSNLYREYMEELLRSGKQKEALLVLDHSRAETLAERSDSSDGQSTGREDLWATDPSALARRVHGTILVYCLRPQTSYLWVIAPTGSSFVRLPGQEVLLPLVESHTRAILAGRDVLAQESAAGLTLYDDLVGPAAKLLPAGGKVFVIADQALNHLNFETLLVPTGKPHFWIEDVDVVNAKSLSLLAAGSSAPHADTRAKKLLMVGDPVYTRPDYVKLPHAAEEVADVAAHFSPDRRVLLTGTQATRAQYLESHPGEFGYIHFVAHATANELNPLDSAVILSGQPGAPDAYKLYARDIMDSRIQADLVTISACFGSGVRTYSGEGLVGLAWAFLRAGSHNVVGALWEVSDVSTPQLMNDLYDGLAEGRTPDVALRSAKLAMMQRGGAFRKPFYWAAFQLYSGA